MYQFEAGFVLSAILDELTHNKKNQDFRYLLNKLSYFKVDTDSNLDFKNNDSIVSVYYNLISRGLPTYPSTFIEDIFSNTFVKTRKISDNNNFAYSFVNDEYHDEIIKALHIIDPRQKPEEIIPPEFIENKQIKNFLLDYVSVNIGQHFLHKLSFNRTYNNIFENSPSRRQFYQQYTFDDTHATSISCELPYANNRLGLIVDFLRQEQKNSIDYLQLEKLNADLNKINWESKVLLTQNEQDTNELLKIVDFSYEKYLDYLRKNYASPLFNNEFGITALQLALTPIAIARIQKILLAFIASGLLNFNDKKWKIAVIERDVPAASIAIEDLKNHFENLFFIEGKDRKLPEIELAIYFTPEFENAELNLLYQGEILPLENFKSDVEYDLLIDLSVLQYYNFSTKIENSAKNFVRILSSDYYQNKRHLIVAEKINYRLPLFDNTIIKNNKQKQTEQKLNESFNFFYKNFFHKQKLTFLQQKYLTKIFSGDNNLSVVPAKEQFDFVYKFVVLMQPSISVLVTSLMASIKYNFDILLKYHIDCASYYTASTQNIFDKIQALQKLKNAQSLFNFITPDRLHLNEFRQILSSLEQNNILPAYIIVDQAHSVSEWSFNFNPLYPTIYKNFINSFAKKLQFLCLSETASYDVIDDIYHYFKIQVGNIISVESTLSNVNLNFVSFNSDSNSNNIDKIDDEKFQFVKQNTTKHTIYLNDNPQHYNELLNQEQLNSLDYEGTIDYKSHFISTTKSRQSYRNYRKYIKSETEILSANNTLALSCPLDADKIFFHNIPLTPEFLIQSLNETFNSPKVDVIVLFSNGQTSFTETEFDFDEEGNFLEKQYSSEIDIEDITRKIDFYKFFPNFKKELLIINELWKQIRYPNESIADILTRRVYFSFDINIWLEKQPQDNPTKLYVYDEYDNPLGYIDFEKNQIVNQSNQSKFEQHSQILEFIKYDIEKIVSDGIEIFAILNEPMSISQNSGIYDVWNNQIYGAKFTVTIEFYNNATNIFIDKHNNHFTSPLKFNQIIYLYEQSYDQQNFIDNFYNYFQLIEESFKKTVDFDLQTLYWNFRTFYDTLFALYRLYSINIMDDYIIDFQNQQFYLIFSKKPDTEILNSIYKKISIYLPKNISFGIYEKVNKSIGDSIVEKAINFYERFVYEAIYRRNKLLMNKMSNIIKNNIGQEQNILPLLNNYFSAKYLFDLEKHLESTDLYFIDQYFDVNYLFFDDIKHLYRSSELLLNIHEDNYNMLIINGLTGILLNSNNDAKIAENTGKITHGISFYRNIISDKDLGAKIENIIKIIENFDFELKNKVSNLLFIKLHNNWLTQFNKKIKMLFNTKLK